MSRKSRNTMQNFESFIVEWVGGRRQIGAEEIVFPLNSFGSINTSGQLDGDTVAFSPHNPAFLSSIEPRVRGLVGALVYDLGLITYSSCEGHINLESGEIIASGHVGLFSHLPTLAQIIDQIIVPSIQNVNARSSTVAEILLTDEKLETEVGPIECREILFRSNQSCGSKYVVEVDILASFLVSEILGSPQ